MHEYLENLTEYQRAKIIKLTDAIVKAVASKDFSEVRNIMANETDQETLKEMRVLSNIALAVAKGEM
jgi:hypothetical protein